jgi:hypothetical protein
MMRFVEELMQGSCLMGYGAVTLGMGRVTGVPKDREVFTFKGHAFWTAYPFGPGAGHLQFSAPFM